MLNSNQCYSFQRWSGTDLVLRRVWWKEQMYSCHLNQGNITAFVIWSVQKGRMRILLPQEILDHIPFYQISKKKAGATSACHSPARYLQWKMDFSIVQGFPGQETKPQKITWGHLMVIELDLNLHTYPPLHSWSGFSSLRRTHFLDTFQKNSWGQVKTDFHGHLNCLISGILDSKTFGIIP